MEVAESATQQEPSTGVAHTVELPLTEAVRAVLLAERASNSLVRAVGIRLLFAVGVPLLLFLIALNTSSGPRQDQYVIEFMLLPVVFAIIAGPLSVSQAIERHNQGKEANDLNLAEGVYLRTSGSGTLCRRTHHKKPDTYHIKATRRALAPLTNLPPLPVRSGQSFAPKDETIEFVIKRPSGLDPALWEKITRRALLFDIGSDIQLEPYPITAEHTKYGHLLLSVRDANGKLLYRHLEYYAD